jgi:hypothetical protein
MRYIGLVLHVATALLIVLKLVGAVKWPWLWVLAPSITAFSMGIIILAFAGVCLAIHKLMMRDPNYRLRHALENMQRALRQRQ